MAQAIPSLAVEFLKSSDCTVTFLLTIERKIDILLNLSLTIFNGGEGRLSSLLSEGSLFSGGGLLLSGFISDHNVLTLLSGTCYFWKFTLFFLEKRIFHKDQQ